MNLAVFKLDTLYNDVQNHGNQILAIINRQCCNVTMLYSVETKECINSIKIMWTNLVCRNVDIIFLRLRINLQTTCSLTWWANDISKASRTNQNPMEIHSQMKDKIKTHSYISFMYFLHEIPVSFRNDLHCLESIYL